jgi:hypothetical protein
MQTMYNGVNPADFPVAQGEPEDPTIVFVGRVDPLKDLHTLIRAFAMVRERIPNARLRMFGPVSSNNKQYHASCEQLITKLGLSGAAAFEGAIARQTDAYEAGHLVALTSVSEGFPFTVVESMSMGRPPVCTNVGGVSEAVGKDAGFVVPPRDHAAVADACIRLLEDADLRHSCGARARERVLERFTLSQWTNAYREIYAALVPAVTPDARVSLAGDGSPSAQQALDPTVAFTPSAYSRITRDLTDVAHSNGLDARAPRQENGDETRSQVEVHHEETPGRAINGRPLNGSTRKAEAPAGSADAVPEPVDGPADETVAVP